MIARPRNRLTRAFEWFGLRDNPADDGTLTVYLMASLGVMLLAGRGPQETGPLGTWWSLFGVALMAVLVGRAKRPERHWASTAIAGVAAVAFTPLGVVLVLGAEPSGVALAALVGVPGALAAAVAALGRRGAASRRAGR